MFMLWQAGSMEGLEDMCLVMLGREEDRPTNELVLLDMILHTHVERNHMDKADNFLRRCIASIPSPTCTEYVHAVSRLLGLCVYRDMHFEASELMSEVAQWMPTAALKPKYEGGSGFQSNTMRDAVAIWCFALSQVGRADEAIKWLHLAVEKQYNPEDEVSEATTDSDLSSDTESDEEHDDMGTLGPGGTELSDREESQVWEDDIIDDDAPVKDCIISDVMLLDLLGFSLQRHSHLQNAIDCHIKALKIKVLSSGANDASVSFTLSEIASCYECQRRKADAYRMREAAATLMKEVGQGGGTGLSYYKALHAQAACFWKFGDYEQGAVIAERAVYAVQGAS